jgi:hypothetical protein
MSRSALLNPLLAGLVALSGCGSVAKGVTEALLEHQDKDDTRSCEIRGPAFAGIESFIKSQEADRATVKPDTGHTTKVLMVHGIGKHLPGYSARLSRNLTEALGLDVTEERFKEIAIEPLPLLAKALKGRSLGNLRVQRFMNKARSRELLFYELTWSDITVPDKNALEFDESDEQTYKRASVNNAIKEFFNSHAPDPMIYLGKSRQRILASVEQALCLMFSRDWKDLDAYRGTTCGAGIGAVHPRIERDDFAFVTHSMGSQILVDALGRASDLHAERDDGSSSALREKEIPVFMLANQLPLLQLGRDRPKVTGQIERYCTSEGAGYGDRLFNQVRIVAFSDPNDILSYAISPGFAEEYIDSRLCPKIVNVSLNVAEVVELFGLGEFANPADAHRGYDNDDRVIAIIAKGVGRPEASAVIQERCNWLETVSE